MNSEGDDGGEASSGQLLFSSCSWVRSTKTPPACSGTTPSQTAPCRCSILQSLVDAPSGIDTPTTAPSRSYSVNLFPPWPRGAALCTPARLPPGVSPPFHFVADIWPWMSLSWSLLPNQDCISNILASFIGSSSAILAYRLYSSIDLLLHNTFTRRRWFLNGKGEEQRWFWIRTGEELCWFWIVIGEEGRWF